MSKRDDEGYKGRLSDVSHASHASYGVRSERRSSSGLSVHSDPRRSDAERFSLSPHASVKHMEAPPAIQELPGVASAMSQLYDPDTIAGVVSTALRKELMHLWAMHDAGSLSVTLVDAIVATVSPNILRHFLEVANRRVSGATANAGRGDASPSAASPLEEHTRIPEAPCRLRVLEAVGGDGASSRAGNGFDGGAALSIEHGELLEELQGVLGSLDLLTGASEALPMLKKEVAPRMAQGHPWQRWLRGNCSFLLPADSVLGICTVTAPALLAAIWAARGGASTGEELSEAPQTARGQPQQPDASQLALYDKESLPAGAPQGLAKAVRCRRRVFALERELVAREQAEREREAFEKAERAKSEARIMEVNKVLSEKLKARTEELKRAGQKIVEAHRAVDEMRGQLTEKKREISRLEYTMNQSDSRILNEKQRDQEHSRSLLRAAERENLAMQRAKQRADALQKCADAGSLAAFLEEAAVEDASGKPASMLEQLERDFQVRIQRRKEKYDSLLSEFQYKVDIKRAELNNLTKRIEERKAALETG